MRRYGVLTGIGLALLAGCAVKPKVVAVAPPPPAPPAPAPLAMPKGAYVGMQIPALMSDGRYATPNRNLSADGAVWHLRAALNVAALACRGPDEAAIIAGYNTLLAQQKATLAGAQTRLTAEYKTRYGAGGGDWQDRYDDQMTRLYNFFSQSQARDAFCNAAAATLADSATVSTADLPAFAAGRLAVLEKPFTDFYAAYDAWRAERAAATRMAMANVAPMTPRSAVVQDVPAPVPASRPRLVLDPSVFVDASASVTQ
ncbi:hypothetical protein M9979_04705 [Sphingomonas sp. RP10(2022)]|uniref:Lipoprotein n=1 Tax=Sphingomonas liriopis TaxID=2949094 RepID=A0A9X2HPS5_9SPHN|nr:hypothetical protein [Sphingomonas liriopis]MCP3734177.1 hypothetical protein [Sphingomonas liriopis]